MARWPLKQFVKSVAQPCLRSEETSNLTSRLKTQKGSPASGDPFDFPRVFSILKKVTPDVPLEIFQDNPYQALVSTLMSARTNDNVTLLAAKRLFAKAPTLKKLDQLGELEI